MKNKENVIKDRSNKIELNNLKIIDYVSHDKIICECNKCGYKITDNHRNFGDYKYKCRYCILINRSRLIMDGSVKIISIEGKRINLKCSRGHVYIQDRGNLLSGKRCNQCYLDNKIFTKEDVLVDFSKIHGDYYSYNLDNFKNLHTKIEITCKKGHIFMQKVSNHLQGKGCPVCRESLGERTISNYLLANNIEYIRQTRFDGCKFINKLPFDFYIPKLDMCIEYDGIQHFKPVKAFGGTKEFNKTIVKDKIKDEYCCNNNIHLLRISCFENIIEKLKTIQKYIILNS